MPDILFLPGAGGAPEFWQPVARRLPAAWDKVLLGWPGLGDQPHDPAIQGLDDLVRLVQTRIEHPVDLVAQSMGGGIAARIAIERPALVRRLVLVVTSAGVDMEGLGAADWRAAYRRDYPHAAEWILQPHAAAELPIERIVAPTLLICGDADPISPVAVGRHLEWRMPNARLHVVANGDHALANNQPDLVAQLIAQHLA